MLDFIFGSDQRTKNLALPGRSARPYAINGTHYVLGTPIDDPPPDEMQEIVVAMGCFWGAERTFWRLPGVYTTAVGYVGGVTANATYEEVCTGRTGHTEAVRVVFHPEVLPLDDLLATFWESHDPTQGMRQGNDSGTQYRSGLYWTTAEQRERAEATRDSYARSLAAAGRGSITTELRPLGDGEADAAGPFFYAEDYHQQYLAKGAVRSGLSSPENLLAWYRESAPEHASPREGYCSMRGTGVTCQIGTGISSQPDG